MLLTIHPRFDRKDGRNAMAFTQELYDLNLPPGVRGPIGETAVFAETLWVVTGEGLWLTLLTLLGVLVLVWLNRGSLKDALWILFPLTLGVVLTFGIMAVLGLKLNFFNVVVIPALFGMGVDLGVHFYRRCMEMGGDTAATFRELFEPLSVTTITTMLGYSGMVFARHPGIHSIGILACLGLIIIWMTSMVMLPGMLNWFWKRAHGQRKSEELKG
jgi:predicted RND superfamily exporter protein